MRPRPLPQDYLTTFAITFLAGALTALSLAQYIQALHRRITPPYPDQPHVPPLQV
ncbi:MAG: hypothetical protein JO006_00865 [Paucibacter sp.]|nr:hypothetical protein [Roseateles sp.]